MKRMLILCTALLLALFPSAMAEDALILSGNAVRDAQYIPTILESTDSFAFTLTEYDEEGTLSFMDDSWFGHDADGSILAVVQSSSGELLYLRGPVAIRWTADDPSCTAQVYLPDALTALQTELYSLLMLYPQAKVSPCSQEDGTLTLQLTGDGLLTEYVLDADTLRLIRYQADQLADGQQQTVTTITTATDTACPAPAALTDAFDHTRTVTLHGADGSQTDYAVPSGMPIAFVDEEGSVLLFADAALTRSVDAAEAAALDEVWVSAE